MFISVNLETQKPTNMTLNKFCFACIFFTIVISLGCSRGNKKNNNHLGEVNFTATGKSEAQPAFKKGILLLHNFEYADAAEQFREAKKTDPGFVMAYWGEAMTYNHPLWQEQDVDKGNEILNQLGATAAERIAKATTDIEKGFLKGVHILYGKGNKAERDSSYAAWMESLYNKYAANDEVAAFYSLALNGWGTTEHDNSILEKAAVIAFEVLDRNPGHPGALHYIIHAYDNPDYAAKALAIADKYALVAPDAGHALHMPTHTYLALGQWEKVISSNEVSWAAEQKRKERKKLDNDALGYHAFHWLQYGYLQKGNNEKARSMVDSMKKYCSELSSSRARAHMILLKTTYLANTNDYDKDVVSISVDLKDLNMVARAKNYFVTGMSAYYNNDAVELQNIILKLTSERLLATAITSDKGLRLCGNINRSLSTKTDLQEAEVMELELRAMEALLKKDAGKTELFFKKATELQTLSGYSYGPPAIVKPSFEMYGEWLLENNRPKDALEQFEYSLKLMPNKTLSVTGKQKAQKLLKDNPVAVL